MIRSFAAPSGTDAIPLIRSRKTFPSTSSMNDPSLRADHERPQAVRQPGIQQRVHPFEELAAAGTRQRRRDRRPVHGHRPPR